MLFPTNLAVVASLASLNSAFPKGGGGGSGGGGHASSGRGGGVGRRAALGSVAGYGIGSLGGRRSSPAPYGSSEPGSLFADSPSGSTGDQDSTDSHTSLGSSGLPSNAPAALYTISNVTIHQYPGSGNGLNGSSSSSSSSTAQIMEDFNLTVSSVSNVGGDSNPPAAVQCNLTWTASTANPSDPPVTGQMKCLNQTGSSVPYNVTLQQQTVSPLPGFFVFVSEG